MAGTAGSPTVRRSVVARLRVIVSELRSCWTSAGTSGPAGFDWQADTRDTIMDSRLDILENEFLCVAGPSGCGKSTLISAIAGFLKATGGNRLIAADSGDDRRRAEAGHVDPAGGLTEDQWHSLADGLNELGAKCVTLSDSDGAVYDKDGIDAEKLAWVMGLKNNRRGRIKEYIRKFPKAEYIENQTRPDGSDLRQLTDTRGLVAESDGTIIGELPGPIVLSSGPR